MPEMGSMSMRWLLLAGLLITYGMIVIVAGHGLGPIAVLLILGRVEEWLPGQALGWLGIGIVIGSVAVRSPLIGYALQAWAAIALMASAAAFIQVSDAVLFSSVFALPLLAISAFIGRCYWLMRSHAAADLTLSRPWPVLLATGLIVASIVYEAAVLLSQAPAEGLDDGVIVEWGGLILLLAFTLWMWLGQGLARWGILAVFLGLRLYFIQDLVGAVIADPVTVSDIAGWLALDVSILALLFSAPACAWFRRSGGGMA